VGPAADEVVETLVVVAVFVPGVAVDALDVVSVVPDFDVVVPEPLPLENVEPMSPQRMPLKTTCVVGLFLMMLVGLPSVASQGPLLPPSSQFM
jgi:hypothetical protein